MFAGRRLVGMFLMPAALADDVDDVKAAEMDFMAAENAGGTDDFFKHFYLHRTVYGS